MVVHEGATRVGGNSKLFSRRFRGAGLAPRASKQERFVEKPTMHAYVSNTLLSLLLQLQQQRSSQ